MTLCVNNSGTYRNITTLCINDSGTYRNTITLCINDSGTYRKILPLQPGALCSSFGGGFLICKPGSSPAWVVSPYSAEVTRSWYLRNEAATKAQQVSGVSGWFIPTKSQLQNPGYCCRDFWGPSPCYTPCKYWTETEWNTPHGCTINFTFSQPAFDDKNSPCCVRAFRCVTY